MVDNRDFLVRLGEVKVEHFVVIDCLETDDVLVVFHVDLFSDCLRVRCELGYSRVARDSYFYFILAVTETNEEFYFRWIASMHAVL